MRSDTTTGLVAALLGVQVGLTGRASGPKRTVPGTVGTAAWQDARVLDDSVPAVTRRGALSQGGALAVAIGALRMTRSLAVVPRRTAVTAQPSDIQFNIAAFMAGPPQTFGSGVLFQMPPVHTVFLTGRLLRAPTRADQAEMGRVLQVLEQYYPWGAGGLVTFVGYGLPYFTRLPGGLRGTLVRRQMPRLLTDRNRYVLEEAVPGPTDVSAANPGLSKLRFQMPVVIEHNDLLFTLRSDNSGFLQDVLGWFGGSNRLHGQPVRSPAWRGLVRFTSSRHMFVQRGLPRLVAEQHGLPFADFINRQSPMWMGFADQQTDGSGPAAICTFAGNSSARLTTARPGDYFDNGSVQHLSHVVLDMLQFFDMASPSAVPGAAGTFAERVQLMFHAPPIASEDKNPYADGGGPALLPNEYRGPDYAKFTAQGIGTLAGQHRMGHLSCVQRVSRAADDTPIHLRMDGPGFDSMDMPGGGNQPKLQFTIFVPSAAFFTSLRTHQASLDLQRTYDVQPGVNGLERFLTTTRRQNFLVPPRRHRAFPLTEFT